MSATTEYRNWRDPDARATVVEVAEEAAPTQTGRIEIRSEPLTYAARLVRDPRGPLGLRALSTSPPRSYVRDLASWTRRTGDWQGAGQRLERHVQEMRVEGERREAFLAPDIAYETRAPGWTTGTGGYFAPPLWLVQYFATVPTPERILSAAVPTFDLPVGAQSVNLPRWTAGAEVGEQQLGAAGAGTDLADSAVSSAVATIAGNADVPMQMLEQSPAGAHLDWAVFTNMEARYGYQLEQQLISGNGASTPQGSGNNQLLGILSNTSVPTANKVTYTDATPTVKTMIETAGSTQGGPLAQLIAAVGNNRKVKPEAWMMTTSRAAWLASGEIAFPIALTNHTGPGHFDLLAYPVQQNDAIPTNLGPTSNQDTIILCRPSDWLLLESEPRTSIFMEVLSGSLMARLQMRRYVAALLRYPSSVAFVSGSGMVVQANF